MPRIEIAEPLTLFAPAKLNLGLEVLGRRADGFHQIVSILQTVSIFDRIDLLPARHLSYVTIGGIRRDEDLVWRALRVAETRLDVTIAAEIRLHKSIPVAAGLGGGSSDAGTLLGALASLIGLTRDTAREAAAALGSDVPFFVSGGTATARGTGARVSSLPDLRRAWFVVVTPDLILPEKTRTLYGELKPTDLSNGDATQMLEERIRAGDALDPRLMTNSFTRPLLARAEVRRAVEVLRAAGAELVLPAGAGPSVFAPVRGIGDAKRLSAGVASAGYVCRVCTTVRAGLNDGRLAAATVRQSTPRE